MKQLGILALCMALIACGTTENDPGVGGVTAGEAEALNAAAEMLDNAHRDILANDAAAANLTGQNVATNVQAVR